MILVNLIGTDSVPTFTEIVPKLAGIVPKHPGIVPKVEGIVPKLAGIVPKVAGTDACLYNMLIKAYIKKSDLSVRHCYRTLRRLTS